MKTNWDTKFMGDEPKLMSKYKHQQAMKKDWSIEQWKSSSDPLDRLIWFISIQSPHNWWRSREALDEQLSKKEEEVLNSKKKRVVLVLEFSVDANGTPQIVETWDYDKKILNQFTSMQLGVIILGLLEEKRKHHKNFLPLIERFCEIFLAHYKTQNKK